MQGLLAALAEQWPMLAIMLVGFGWIIQGQRRTDQEIRNIDRRLAKLEGMFGMSRRPQPD